MRIKPIVVFCACWTGVASADGLKTVFLSSESAEGSAVLKSVGAAAAANTPEAHWARQNLKLVLDRPLSADCRPDMSNVVQVATTDGVRAVTMNEPRQWALKCPWLDVTREYARLNREAGGEGTDLGASGARLFEAIVHAFRGAPGDQRVPAADPHVLLWDGRYYLYGTGDASAGFRAYVSDDLENWSLAVGRAAGGLVFARGDGFGSRDFWAPEVHVYGGRFYLFYSADGCCAVAVSDSPLGPFRNPGKEPLVARPHGQAIDSTLFVDDDGTPWMAFSDNQRTAFVKLASDLLSVVPGSHFYAFSEPHESWQMNTEEGQSVVRIGGKYVLLYSGDGCQSQDYAVGVGVADRITGPWKRLSGYRFLHRAGGLTGTGHGSPLRLSDGSWRYVFHAHETPTVMGRRRTYVAPMSFEGGVPRLTGMPSACTMRAAVSL